jgi:hypothetical protein
VRDIKMYRMKSIIATIFLSSLVALCIASAEDCQFGTKVLPGDYDIGRLIKNIPNNSAIGFWDIGPNPGFYDEEDIVYLDMTPIPNTVPNTVGIINANDIRLTSFGNHPAGSKVTPYDNDIGKILTPFAYPFTWPCVIGFLNLKGSEFYDLEDPVYLHQSSVIALKNAKADLDRSQQNCEGFSNYDPDTGKGYCGIPRGSTRITFTDGYSVVVPEKIADLKPKPADFKCDGGSVELIQGTSGSYYHIYGTNKLKVVGPSLLTRMVLLEKSVLDNEDDINNLTWAVNYISATSQQTVTNDIRLNSFGSYIAGTKVVDFDVDHNKLIPSILVTFPNKASNMGALRFYDQNGNGLYDAPDDVYMDISYPGGSPTGQVVINDLRLTTSVCSSKEGSILKEGE